MFCVKPQAEPPHHVSAATGKGPFPRPRAGAGRTCVPSSFGSIPRSTLAGWRAKSVFSFVRNRPCVAPRPRGCPARIPMGSRAGAPAAPGPCPRVVLAGVLPPPPRSVFLRVLSCARCEGLPWVTWRGGVGRGPLSLRCSRGLRPRPAQGRPSSLLPLGRDRWPARAERGVSLPPRVSFRRGSSSCELSSLRWSVLEKKGK